jgi:hypothetical protein
MVGRTAHIIATKKQKVYMLIKDFLLLPLLFYWAPNLLDGAAHLERRSSPL